MKKTLMIAGEAKMKCQQEMAEHPENFSEKEIETMRNFDKSPIPNCHFPDSVAFSIIMKDVVEPWAERNNINIFHL